MDLAAEIEALKAQVRTLAAREEIRRLLATYAFNADIGRVEEYLAGWTDDGVYDLSEDMLFEGKVALGSLVATPDGFHKRDLENRSQHLVANLLIEVAGDTAWAEGYSVVTLLKDGQTGIFAAGYNHWDFVRQDGRWLMKLRRRRTVGGPTWGGEVLTSYLD
jgi:hypothetical protein